MNRKLRKIAREVLSSPLKLHNVETCSCNGCAVQRRKREIRAEAIKKREGK